MITDKGKDIIGKYLLGQAPAYASYLAVGCGAQPLETGDPKPDFSEKANLDFEMFRVPISSRGFVNEAGTTKIVLTAQLPTEERYEISEVALYSAGSNPTAGAYDSKTVFAFTQAENWQHHTLSAATAIPFYAQPLDDPNDDNIIAVTDLVFQSNADNNIFYKSPRFERYERCRFLNNVIFIRGDDSDIQLDINDNFDVQSGNHIHLLGANVDFNRNSPIDELRLAFALVSKDGDSSSVPDTVRIMVEFAATDSGSGEYARFEANLNNGIYPGEYDFSTNRYWVVSKQLQELVVSPNFSWNAVTVAKIYVSVLVGGVPSEDYYVALDAMRLENIATQNPLYGMTGYSLIENNDASTIVKNPNTSNYVEFRFSLGVS